MDSRKRDLRTRAGLIRLRTLLGASLAGALFTAASCGAAADALPTNSTSAVGDRSAQAAPAIGETAEHEASLFAIPTTHDHIGRVVVPVMIDGRGPFRFVVDTGANRSTISPGLVQALGLKPAGTHSVTLEGITGSAQVSYVSIASLQTGDLRLSGITLPVVWAPVMAGADGILGAAGLSERALMVDFLRNRVVISPHVEADMRVDSTRIHARRLAPGLIAVDARIGEVPVCAIIDTGSERTLGNIALRDALHARTAGNAIALVTSVYGATKQAEQGQIERAPPVSLGGLHISGGAIVYGAFHIFDVWGLHDRPAMIIGMDVLGTVAALGIDFKREYVYLTAVKPRGEMVDELKEMHGVTAAPAVQR